MFLANVSSYTTYFGTQIIVRMLMVLAEDIHVKKHVVFTEFQPEN